VATFVGPSKRSLGLGQLSAPAEQDAQAERGVRAATPVRTPVRVLCAREVAGSLESNAEL
jgi:hypothetical protein